MAEREQKRGTPEQQFIELEGKLVEKIKIAHKESWKAFPDGAAVEITANEGKDFRLCLDSNGKWSMRYKKSGFEIKGEPNLSRILDAFLFVTDALYRNLEIPDRVHYLRTNENAFTESLFDKMRGALANLD